MKLLTIQAAEALLHEAEQRNPGPWIGHSLTAARCASTIAQACGDMDTDTAYVLGLLHDIGRGEGVTDLRHVIEGWRYLSELGYHDAARICLTHSFPIAVLESYQGKNDCSPEETLFLKQFLSEVQYDEYDRLIQLCDAISLPGGPTFIEKRLVDVALRRGLNEYTIPKWRAFLDIKACYERRTGIPLERLMGVNE